MSTSHNESLHTLDEAERQLHIWASGNPEALEPEIWTIVPLKRDQAVMIFEDQSTLLFRKKTVLPKTFFCPYDVLHTADETEDWTQRFQGQNLSEQNITPNAKHIAHFFQKIARETEKTLPWLNPEELTTWTTPQGVPPVWMSFDGTQDQPDFAALLEAVLFLHIWKPLLEKHPDLVETLTQRAQFSQHKESTLFFHGQIGHNPQPNKLTLIIPPVVEDILGWKLGVKTFPNVEDQKTQRLTALQTAFQKLLKPHAHTWNPLTCTQKIVSRGGALAGDIGKHGKAVLNIETVGGAASHHQTILHRRTLHRWGWNVDEVHKTLEASTPWPPKP